MHDWLPQALADNATIITGNRRLARQLRAQHAKACAASGQQAWRTPKIFSLNGWLSRCLDDTLPVSKPQRFLTSGQSRQIWERVLKGYLDDPLTSASTLLDAILDSWQLIHEWQIPLDDCRRYSRNRDHLLLVDVAAEYQRTLAASGWKDRAELPTFVAQRIRQHEIAVPARIVLAGFDRLTPQQHDIVDALRGAKCDCEMAPTNEPARQFRRLRFAAPEDELRAAGAWARQQLEAGVAPDELAIVVTQLEQNSAGVRRHIANGLMPGWQTASEREQQGIDVSYGQPLAGFPAIQTALLALRWLIADLPSVDVSRLLLSPLLSAATLDLRARIDRELRRYPYRGWSLERFAETFLHDEDESVSVWPEIKRYQDSVVGGGEKRRPSEWATHFATALQTLGWPGSTSATSAEFQLLNRWQELLFEMAQVATVDRQITGNTAWRYLARSANDTLYQAENTQSAVAVLGPLEAAGMQFDALWVTGMTADQWPPARRSQALIPRDVQRQHNLPDSTPADTLEYAQRVIHRLSRSADTVVFSHPEFDGDQEQAETALLEPIPAAIEQGDDSVGNGGKIWTDLSEPVVCADDRVPALSGEEILKGGAATVALQLSDPFAAFAKGRLGIERLPAFEYGLSAAERGIQLHSALQALYAECPAQNDIAAWSEHELDSRAKQSVRKALWRMQSNADDILKELLALEQGRLVQRVQEVVAADLIREPFAIRAIEHPLETAIGGVRLKLRIDRIDQVGEGGDWLLDYKTGARRALYFNRELRDYQLVVYSCALPNALDGFALYHVNAKQTALSEVSRNRFDDWDEQLANWQREVIDACQKLAAGDVRIGHIYRRQDQAPWAILSRVQEVLGRG
ncbi:MAG: PD-(D/E)XK nuclease family protein [Pseudomonadota bacterium]